MTRSSRLRIGPVLKCDPTSVVRRFLQTRIACFRWFIQQLQAALQPCDLFAVASQFRVQTQQRLVHLFEIVLGVSQCGLKTNQSVFDRCHDGLHGMVVKAC